MKYVTYRVLNMMKSIKAQPFINKAIQKTTVHKCAWVK